MWGVFCCHVQCCTNLSEEKEMKNVEIKKVKKEM